jgi:1-acyl-sn-glycerol-3-phosphate acyltransferase
MATRRASPADRGAGDAAGTPTIIRLGVGRPVRAPSVRDHSPTPLAFRLVRSVRVTAHMMTGLATTAFVFPWVAPPKRHAIIRHWCSRLLHILRVEARIHGFPESGLPGNLLIVANHISWLDIFVLSAVQPSRFIAKAEVRSWPLIGRLATGAGTLFIDRERRHDTHKVGQHAAEALARGEVVAVFPEGTTTDGTTLLKFHGSLLQPIVETEGHVQPVAIRYRRITGEHSTAPSYAGETTFMESFWRVTGERRLVVEMHLAAPLPARERHRRELVRAAEAAIRTALALPASGSEPDTHAGPPA